MSPAPADCPLVVDDRLHWSIDRRVPLGLIVTMTLQIAGMIWWARGMQADVDAGVSRIGEHERRLKIIDDVRDRERIGERMATLENELRNQSALLRRIDERTERLMSRSR